MIKPGQIIKHPKFMDVAFLVHRVTPRKGFKEYLDVMGEWVNQGYAQSFRIGETQSILLPTSQWSEWLVCLEPELKSLRDASWSNIQRAQIG